MTNRPKQQGTRHESWIVNQFSDRNLEARRIAEGGSADEGDVETHIVGERWILEGKARQNLNVQATLGKARRKAGGGRVAVVWKRLVRAAGMKNRQPVEGERVVVILSFDDFMHLVTNAGTAEATNTTEKEEQK